MSPAPMTVSVGTHLVTIEKMERYRWRVSVDGQRLATFCSESRARAAGRAEARRQDYTLAAEPRGRAGPPALRPLGDPDGA